MIRLFTVIGILGVVIATYLATFGQGRDFQMPPKMSLMETFEAQGLLPNANAVTENEEIEHDIFDVPPEDEEQLKMAMANMDGMDMGGMDMGEDGAMKMKVNPDGSMAVDADGNMIMEPDDKTAMKMDEDKKDEPAMKMKLNADGTMAVDADGNMIMEPDDKTAMKMDEDKKDEPAMKMKLNADGTMAVDADGNMIMEEEEKPHGEEENAAMKEGEEEVPHGEGEPEGGLVISEKEGEAFDREIKMSMSEWNYSNLNIEVKPGERVKFTLTNKGKIPHEFMFMTMPAMAAINYRATRADWSLLEHEALYEKSLVLPGGTFSFVADVKEAGVWMFMCMLPYHMQMGMMGQLATPGRAMEMPGMRM
ncbi:MAG: multicopper oxidase domain-containing protein [Rhizobiaceae bacterium]|nr:multicopper oxidase domain-containing protein [Rhizobiaceae bacterium]